jgi:hypothetical protein
VTTARKSAYFWFVMTGLFAVMAILDSFVAHHSIFGIPAPAYYGIISVLYLVLAIRNWKAG